MSLRTFEYQKTRRLGQTRCEIENNLFTMKFNKQKHRRYLPNVMKNEHPFIYVVICFYIRETQDGKSFLLKIL